MSTIAKRFPKSKGWITAKLTLHKGVQFTEDDAKNFVSFGKPHRCQFGLIDISRNPVKVVYREIRKAALDPDATPNEWPMDMATPVPFIARCGSLIIQVEECLTEFAPMQMIRGEILDGKHFNDRGDYGLGDTVTIGPLTEHWRILTFPDSPED